MNALTDRDFESDDTMLKQIQEDASNRYKPHAIEIHRFGSPDVVSGEDFLNKCGKNHEQGRYLQKYLTWMDAAFVLQEKNYSDWEFASQFQVYYGASAAGYPNLCQRYHYISKLPSLCDLLGETKKGQWMLGEDMDKLVNQSYEFYKTRIYEHFDKIKSLLNSMQDQDATENMWIPTLLMLERAMEINPSDRTLEDFAVLDASILSVIRIIKDGSMLGTIIEHRRDFEKIILEKLVGGLARFRQDGLGPYGLFPEKPQIEFPELYIRWHLESFLRGIHCLQEDVSSISFGIFSMVHLLSGMPQMDMANHDDISAKKWLETTLRIARSGDRFAINQLQSSYLGYIVRRPLIHAPLGRTLLRWPLSPDTPYKPRVTNTFRNYKAHIQGITLNITGLVWQQQDQATSACASQALFSAFQASAYRHVSTPPSPVITILANKFHSAGQRTFPSRGLNYQNLAEAIRQQEGLVPLVISGDLQGGFTRLKFNAFCPSFLFGEFPVLLFGEREGHDDKHVICLTGFHSRTLNSIGHQEETIDDQPSDKACVCGDFNIDTYYGHDVSIGPNVRFLLCISKNERKPLSDRYRNSSSNPDKPRTQQRAVVLSNTGPASVPTDSRMNEIIGNARRITRCVQNGINGVIPDRNTRDVVDKFNTTFPSDKQKIAEFVPDVMIVALPKNIRSDPGRFYSAAYDKVLVLAQATQYLSKIHLPGKKDTTGTFWPYAGSFKGLSFTMRYVALSGYLETGLRRHLPPDPGLLSRVRKKIVENTRPMSQHVGLLRIGLRLADTKEHRKIVTRPLMDLVYDTTVTDLLHPVFAHIRYLKVADDIIRLSKHRIKEYIDILHDKLHGDLLGYQTEHGCERLAAFGEPIPAYS
ncbi:MAG: hypothetical protein HQL65_17150, partial [Magnetococcales bacterium]|nr:hypothetical protein [Magnetococcales bacterium]